MNFSFENYDNDRKRNGDQTEDSAPSVKKSASPVHSRAFYKLQISDSQMWVFSKCIVCLCLTTESRDEIGKVVRGVTEDVD